MKSCDAMTARHFDVFRARVLAAIAIGAILTPPALARTATTTASTRAGAPATATAPATALGPGVPIAPALVHHPVSTLVPRAQQAFDEGLTLVYAFNRDEARKRFEHAAALDPKLAIAWWGVALAVGPNINFGIDAERLVTASAAIARARALASNGTPVERALIDALARRYPGRANAPTEPGYRAYRDAMRGVHEAYRGDDDVATLYAESVMDSDGWTWTDGELDAPGRSIRTALDGVLAHDPGHVGANHYYIHLMDAEGVAARGVASAERLSMLHVEPAASHLLHMSGHIYLDVGRFTDLERDNRIAVDDDRVYAATLGTKPTELDYYRHNLDFYTGGAVMLDDRIEKERAVGFLREIQSADALLVAARDGHFADVLAAPHIAATASFHERAIDSYARAIASAARGDVRRAQIETDAYDALLRSESSAVAGRFNIYYTALGKLAAARVAHASGDDDTATSLLREAIAATKSLPPEAFPVWFFPAGEWLGWIELRRGNAVAAERAFRDDLARTPHNARAIFGLMESLGHQGRAIEAGPLAYDIVAHWRGPLANLRVATP